jgi:cytochrome c553
MKLGALLILGGLMLAGDASAEGAGDRDAGRKLSSQCSTCHGRDGFARIPIAPHIGGESFGYIASQLTAFRDGTREHEMMSVVARSLSDADIADLAAWYSGHTVEVDLKQDPARAPEQCVACHGADGLHLMEDAPNLAGETNIYIDTQLKAFRNGKRVHEIMTPIAQSLSDQEIRAFADWYAAVGLKITLVE